MFDSSQIQPYISFTDLREWMAEADALGELKTVLGASWQQEIGLATDVVVPPDDGPTVLFDEVPGCPKGFRLLINCFAGKRRAMTLGFPQGLSKQDLSQAYFDHYQRTPKHIAPVIVESGPISRTRSKALISIFLNFPRPFGTSTTAAGTSAPAAFP